MEFHECSNGPQYSSKQFAEFKKEWNFEHFTSSPHFPRSNGFAEKHVAVAKSILRKCKHEGSDVQLALLNHRLTPRNESLGTSSQRLMGRLTRSNLPVKLDLLKPKVIEDVPNELRKLRSIQSGFANRSSRPTKELSEGESVRIQQGKRDWCGGTLLAKHEQPRSYIVKTNDGRIFRRNSHHIRATKANIPSESDTQFDENEFNNEYQDERPIVEADNDATTHSNANWNQSNAPQPQPQATNNNSGGNYITRFGRVSKPATRYPNYWQHELCWVYISKFGVGSIWWTVRS